MKIVLLTIGKTNEKYLIEGISNFTKRLSKYCNFTIVEIPNLRRVNNLSINERKAMEGDLILNRINNNDHLFLLDNKGKSFSSIGFSNILQNQMLLSRKSIIFVIGGAYGFSDKMYNRADQLISLSKMTLSHQMVRLICVEQLYRAYTILLNHPYHNE